MIVIVGKSSKAIQMSSNNRTRMLVVLLLLIKPTVTVQQRKIFKFLQNHIVDLETMSECNGQWMFKDRHATTTFTFTQQDTGIYTCERTNEEIFIFGIEDDLDFILWPSFNKQDLTVYDQLILTCTVNVMASSEVFYFNLSIARIHDAEIVSGSYIVHEEPIEANLSSSIIMNSAGQSSFICLWTYFVTPSFRSLLIFEEKRMQHLYSYRRSLIYHGRALVPFELNTYGHCANGWTYKSIPVLPTLTLTKENVGFYYCTYYKRNVFLFVLDSSFDFASKPDQPLFVLGDGATLSCSVTVVAKEEAIQFALKISTTIGTLAFGEFTAANDSLKAIITTSIKFKKIGDIVYTCLWEYSARQGDYIVKDMKERILRLKIKEPGCIYYSKIKKNVSLDQFEKCERGWTYNYEKAESFFKLNQERIGFYECQKPKKALFLFGLSELFMFRNSPDRKSYSPGSNVTLSCSLTVVANTDLINFDLEIHEDDVLKNGKYETLEGSLAANLSVTLQLDEIGTHTYYCSWTYFARSEKFFMKDREAANLSLIIKEMKTADDLASAKLQNDINSIAPWNVSDGRPISIFNDAGLQRVSHVSLQND